MDVWMSTPRLVPPTDQDAKNLQSSGVASVLILESLEPAKKATMFASAYMGVSFFREPPKMWLSF